jgi:hypothetical protein
MRTDRIAYAVLSFGGFLGMGDKLFAVPWRSLQFRTSDDGSTEYVVLNVDEKTLAAAQGFDEDNWPNMASRVWRERNDRAFGVGGEVDEPDIDADTAEGSRSLQWHGVGGWGHDSEYLRKFRGGRAQTVEGTISEVSIRRPMRDMDGSVQMTVRTSEGQAVVVDLGPAWFVTHQDVRLDQGDRVTIKGHQAQHDGRTIVLAADLKTEDGKTIRLRDSEGRPVWIAIGDGR